MEWAPGQERSTRPSAAGQRIGLEGFGLLEYPTLDFRRSNSHTRTQSLLALFLSWVRCAFQERETEAQQDGTASRAILCILSGAEKLG